MIERILKHMNIYREMKNAAIPLNLIGKKGEDYPVCHYETEETFPGTFAKEWRLAHKP